MKNNIIKMPEADDPFSYIFNEDGSIEAVKWQSKKGSVLFGRGGQIEIVENPVMSSANLLGLMTMWIALVDPDRINFD